MPVWIADDVQSLTPANPCVLQSVSAAAKHGGMRGNAVGSAKGLAVAIAMTLLAACSPAGADKPAGTVRTEAQVTPAQRPALRRLHDLRAARDVQTSFTITPPTPPPAPPPDWLRRLFAWLTGAGKGLITGAVWVIVVAGVIVILYLAVPGVRRTIDAAIARWRGRSPADAHGDAAAWQPDADAARDLIAEADALAAAGRFGAAVHLLLGRSIEELANRRPGLLKPAQTARTIARFDLPAAAAAAFGALTALVEHSRWARQPLDVADWTRARAAYADFALGDHWRTGRGAAGVTA